MCVCAQDSMVWRAMAIGYIAVVVVRCGRGERQQGIEPHGTSLQIYRRTHNIIYNIILYRRGTGKVPRFLLRERDSGGSHNGRVVYVGCKLIHRRRASIGVCSSATAQLSIKRNPAINLFRTRIKSNSIRFIRIGT